MDFSLREVFLKRIPVHLVPTAFEMLLAPFRETAMEQRELGFRALRFQFEPDDRIHAFRPVTRTPSLDDTLIRYEFDIPARDQTAET